MIDPSGARSGDDLDTLLRDAGRAPTIDLDVDEVHDRGRRRALVRRAAAGVGALALLGVAGLGVGTLVDQPDTPVVDEVPSDAPVPEPTEGEDEGPDAEAADRELSARLGATTHRFVDDADGTRIVRATPDSAHGRTARADAGLAGAVEMAVDRDGAVWFSDAAGDLHVLPAGDTEESIVVAAADAAVTWRVLGHDGVGGVLLGRSEPEAASSAQQFTIHRSDGDRVGPALEGLDVLAAIEGDGEPWAAAADPEAPEALAVLDAIGESYGVTVLRQGGEARTAVLAGGLDHWLSDVAIVGRDLWVLEAGTDGDVDVLIEPLDGGELRRVGTPIGRDVEGYVLDLSVVPTAGGHVAALSVGRNAAGGPPVVAYVFDPADVAAEAVTSEPMAAGPTQVPVHYERVELPGRLLLTPLDLAGGEGPLATCATEGGGADVNARPLPGQTVVYYLCWDANGQLPEGVAHPFVPSFRPGGPAEETDAEGLLQLLRTWAEGPTEQETASGLSGGLEPEVATFADIGVDGTQVTVDLASGEQVGVLGTSTGGATFTQAVVGMVLQHDQFATVRITLDGSCQAWVALTQGDPETCPTYDETDAPWWTPPAPASAPRPSEEDPDA